MTLTDLAVITLVITSAIITVRGRWYLEGTYRARKQGLSWVVLYGRPKFWNTWVEFLVLLMVTAGFYLLYVERLHLQP